MTRPSSRARPTLSNPMSPLREFLRTEAAGGILLVIGAAAAMVWANSPWSSTYETAWRRTVSIVVTPSCRGASAGGILGGGLGELVDRFKQSGQSETADSWVKTGANKPCTPAQLESAIGPEVLDSLSKQTGLSRDELVARLCRELPNAVDKYTPEGRLPTEARA